MFQQASNVGVMHQFGGRSLCVLTQKRGLQQQIGQQLPQRLANPVNHLPQLGDHLVAVPAGGGGKIGHRLGLVRLQIQRNHLQSLVIQADIPRHQHHLAGLAIAHHFIRHVPVDRAYFAGPI